MKILHVCKYFYPRISGVTIYVQSLGIEQLAAGHEVSIVTWGDEAEVSVQDGLRVVRVPWGDRKGLLKAIRGESPDVVHSHGIWEHTPLAALAALSLSKPYFVTIHGTWMNLEHTEGFESPWRKFKYYVLYRQIIWRALLKMGAGVIVLNQWEENDVTGFGVGADQIHRIPNGTDPGRFLPSDKTEARKKLGFGGEPLILSVGAIQEQKGVFTILNAARAVAEVREDVRWVFCGDGPDLDKAKEWVKNNGLEERVVFTGRVDRDLVLRHYQAADVFALPSVMEAFGTVFLEAMGCSLPCIGTNDGGTPEIIVDGETGYLMGRDNYAFLAQRVITLVEDPDRAVNMGLAGRKRVEERFSWKKITSQIKTIYDKSYGVCYHR